MANFDGIKSAAMGALMLAATVSPGALAAQTADSEVALPPQFEQIQDQAEEGLAFIPQIVVDQQFTAGGFGAWANKRAKDGNLGVYIGVVGIYNERQVQEYAWAPVEAKATEIAFQSVKDNNSAIVSESLFRLLGEEEQQAFRQADRQERGRILTAAHKVLKGTEEFNQMLRVVQQNHYAEVKDEAYTDLWDHYSNTPKLREEILQRGGVAEQARLEAMQRLQSIQRDAAIIVNDGDEDLPALADESGFVVTAIVPISYQAFTGRVNNQGEIIPMEIGDMIVRVNDHDVAFNPETEEFLKTEEELSQFLGYASGNLLHTLPRAEWQQLAQNTLTSGPPTLSEELGAQGVDPG